MTNTELTLTQLKACAGGWYLPAAYISGVFYCLKAVVSNITALLDDSHQLSH